VSVCAIFIFIYLLMYVFVCLFALLSKALLLCNFFGCDICFFWFCGVFFSGDSIKILKLLYIIIIIFIVKLRVFGNLNANE